MLAYSAKRSVASANPSPNAMLAIIVGHIAVIAAVMSAKMDLPQRIFHPPIIVDTIKEDDPPPPNPAQATRPRPDPIFQAHPTQLPPVSGPDPIFSGDPGPVGVGPVAGTNPVPIPDPIPVPRPAGISSGPQLATPASELKPAYPAAKIASEEEAVLKLRLTIDEQGRVIGVDPVGRADRVFLEAARRHLMSHWRYKPAMENGHAVSSSTVITLHFQLDA
jgi:protein TonB